ncbi:MAG: MmgE/PrpD family protein [Deltaproteobacteria bacterium]|nr:MmgE/PrpD family protein [Deltaproteobacteria bacterium]MBW2119345.1 MmgE/PrpD family protein [Deltaproteobacteria bacterium]MBW2344054.1 MmgE/PrpD family protein [Deltaproteobacteria bacterium]
MEAETRLVEYLTRTDFESIPREPLNTIKDMILGVLGTTVAGSSSEGCEEMVAYHRSMGGREEGTIFVHGGKIPATNAAFVNSVMARALDYCDAMAPGVHIGSSAVPVAFAAAELVGGCSGREFLTALTLGAELSARLNLTESAYDGFDPTGVCTIFAATAIACRILKLSSSQTLNALALAFNKSGGSFQSNIDGSLAVRIIQGWVSQNGLTCALFARTGITGPHQFLEGVYGYFHLFGRDRLDSEQVLGALGERFDLQKMVFKKYPSCGLTQGCTEAILALMQEENITAEDVRTIQVHVPPYAHKLVGHPFQLGENPRVNAQFSIQYCVASALLRGNSRLENFEESAVRDPDVLSFLNKINVTPDPQLDRRGHTALDMHVHTVNGAQVLKRIDVAPGFPGNPLTREEHLKHFRDCLESMPGGLSGEDTGEIPEMIDNIEDLDDVRTIIPHLMKSG